MQPAERNNQAQKMPWANLRLPPFPQVAIKVLQLARNENVQLHQLSNLISSDPAFASEVLTVANSALYSPRYPANNILQAVAVLGANTLQGMCITVGVRAYLGKAMSHPAMRAVWRHNLACALLSQRLATAGSLDSETAYTAGVLHDIGRVALAVIRPKDYGDLLSSHTGTPASILEGERLLFGWDHCETGRQLVEDWMLPAEFEPIVSSHHDEDRPGVASQSNAPWDMNRLVKFGCRLADVAGFPAFAGCHPTPYSDLLAELPEKERAILPAALETLSSQIAESISTIESV